MFATTADVASLTGYAVNEPLLKQANAIIQMVSGRADATNLRSRDRHLLRLATAYQARWMEEHPGLFTDMDVVSHSQLDVSTTYRDDAETSYLAPLARHALKRLSWQGARSVRVDSDFLSDESDIGIPWRPIDLKPKAF